MSDKQEDKRIPDESLEKEAIKLVESEVLQWTHALAWVTDKIAFRMRDLIEQNRKNYWGVFDEPLDKLTGRKKIWIHLTQSLCDAVTKNIRLREDSVKTRAKREKGLSFSVLIRALIRDFFRSIYFGEHLDQGVRQLAVDGTLVWKTSRVDGKPKKKTVNLLNVYLDPSSENIQEAFRFTERAYLTESEVRGMSGWMNTDVKATIGRKAVPKDLVNFAKDSTEGDNAYVDVYEMWGQIPQRLITGKKDDNEMIEGHVVVSGLQGNGDANLHLIERNLKGVKPYEEAWYIKDQSRWYGIGIAEKVQMLQLWLNTVVNIRINRAQVSQLGLFKIRRGAGITPQMMTGLGANGAITVQNLDDVEQLVMQEASQASYTDEGRIIDWAERVTGAFEVVTGEGLAPSTTATAVASQTQTALAQFSMVKKGFGNFLERWLDRQVVPILAQSIKLTDMVNILGEDLVEEVSRCVALSTAKKELDRMLEEGHYPTKSALEAFIDQTIQDNKEQPQLFLTNLQNIVADHTQTEIVVGDEEINQALVAREIINMMNVLQGTRPDLIEPMTKQVFDLLGLDYPRAGTYGKPQGQQSVSSPQGIAEQVSAAITQGNPQNVG